MRSRSYSLLAAALCGIICLNICACSESKNTGGSAVNSESGVQSASDNKTEESSQESSAESNTEESSEESNTEESSEESKSESAANADDDQYTDPYSPLPWASG